MHLWDHVVWWESCNGLLYIANAGDSRAVLGGADRGTREAASLQLSTEESVRDKLRPLHPLIHRLSCTSTKFMLQKPTGNFLAFSSP